MLQDKTDRHQSKAHRFSDKTMSCGLSHKFFNVYETVPKVHYQARKDTKVTVTVELSLSTP